MILRTLLDEKIPIVAFKDILHEFMKCTEKQIDFSTIYNNIRMLEKIRVKLPGNDNYHNFYNLSPEMEKKIETSIINVGYKHVLDLNPTDVKSFLRAIRYEKENRQFITILVKNSSIRRIIQQLIHLEFPTVPVLSRNELLDHLQDLIKGTIV